MATSRVLPPRLRTRLVADEKRGTSFIPASEAARCLSGSPRHPHSLLSRKLAGRQ